MMVKILSNGYVDVLAAIVPVLATIEAMSRFSVVSDAAALEANATIDAVFA
jgi:hypothetical protein